MGSNFPLSLARAFLQGGNVESARRSVVWNGTDL